METPSANPFGQGSKKGKTWMVIGGLVAVVVVAGAVVFGNSAFQTGRIARLPAKKAAPPAANMAFGKLGLALPQPPSPAEQAKKIISDLEALGTKAHNNSVQYALDEAKKAYNDGKTRLDIQMAYPGLPQDAQVEVDAAKNALQTANDNVSNIQALLDQNITPLVYNVDNYYEDAKRTLNLFVGGYDVVLPQIQKNIAPAQKALDDMQTTVDANTPAAIQYRDISISKSKEAQDNVVAANKIAEQDLMNICQDPAVFVPVENFLSHCNFLAKVYYKYAQEQQELQQALDEFHAQNDVQPEAPPLVEVGPNFQGQGDFQQQNGGGMQQQAMGGRTCDLSKPNDVQISLANGSPSGSTNGGFNMTLARFKITTGDCQLDVSSLSFVPYAKDVYVTNIRIREQDGLYDDTAKSDIDASIAVCSNKTTGSFSATGPNVHVSLNPNSSDTWSITGDVTGWYGKGTLQLGLMGINGKNTDGMLLSGQLIYDVIDLGAEFFGKEPNECH